MLFNKAQQQTQLMKSYVFIGPPGSGKGTMAKKLSEDYGFIHLSTGDLIRQHQEVGDKIGQLADRLIDSGNFLPDEIVIQMFQEFIKNNPTDVGYIFDGFPRNSQQAKHFNAFLLKSQIPFGGAIHFELSEKTAQERLSKRAEVEGRKDDTPEVIKHRFGVYNHNTKPVLKFFNDRRKLINVDASGNVDSQYERLKDAIELP